MLHNAPVVRTERANHYDPNVRCRQVIASGNHNLEMLGPVIKSYRLKSSLFTAAAHTFCWVAV
jgi:hypothetical protein